MNQAASEKIRMLQEKCAEHEINLQWGQALKTAMHEYRLLSCFDQKSGEEGVEIAECMFRLGNIHYNMANYVLAKVYLNSAVPIFMRLDMFINLANCYESLCQIAISHCHYEEALNNCNLAIDAILYHRQKESNVSYRQMLSKRIAGLYMQIAWIRETCGEIAAAIDKYLMTLDTSMETKYGSQIKHVGEMYRQRYLKDKVIIR